MEAESGGEPPDDVKPKILNIKVELEDPPSEPGSTESIPEAPCTAEVQEAADTKVESSELADYSDSGEDKTEDQDCGTCAESSEMTSEAGFRTSSRTKTEADSSLLPPKLEQSCGAADGTEHLATSEQHQDAGPATPGQNMVFQFGTFYIVVFKVLYRNLKGS